MSLLKKRVYLTAKNLFNLYDTDLENHVKTELQLGMSWTKFVRLTEVPKLHPLEDSPWPTGEGYGLVIKRSLVQSHHMTPSEHQ